jgi:hypothetical protein
MNRPTRRLNSCVDVLFEATFAKPSGFIIELFEVFLAQKQVLFRNTLFDVLAQPVTTNLCG